MVALVEESQQTNGLYHEPGLLVGFFGRDLEGGVADVGPAAGRGPFAAIHFLSDEQDLRAFAKDDGADIDLWRLIAAFRGEDTDDLFEWLVGEFLEQVDADGADFFVAFEVVGIGCVGQAGLGEGLSSLGLG